MVIQFLAFLIRVASDPPNDFWVQGASGSIWEQSVGQKFVVLKLSLRALDGIECVGPVVGRVPRCLNQHSIWYSQHFLGLGKRMVSTFKKNYVHKLTYLKKVCTRNKLPNKKLQVHVKGSCNSYEILMLQNKRCRRQFWFLMSTVMAIDSLDCNKCTWHNDSTNIRAYVLSRAPDILTIF